MITVIMAWLLLICSAAAMVPGVAAGDPDRSGWIMGDYNNDGAVTIMDATRIQRALAGLIVPDEGSLIRCRVLGGDTLSILDATCIQRYLAALPHEGRVNVPVDQASEIPEASIAPTEQYEWHQCPEAVRRYLEAAEEVYRNDPDYTCSVILDYAPSTANDSNTKPVGMTIDGVTFCDNVPNVAEPFATANARGTLTALDPLRWINTTIALHQAYPRGSNTRDIGGWSCGVGSDGEPCTVKYGMIYRGGEPNAADRELMVEKLGIRSELQLLPTMEQTADRLMQSVWGIDWYGNDTYNVSVYGIIDTPEYAYLWKKYLSAVFSSTASGKPIYIHCGIGADRTGSVMVMLEAILGVPEWEIAQDYELTNFAFYQDATSPRRRNTDAYKSYMNAIKSVPLAEGLSDTFENRAISFALSLGFTAEQIDAYRSACTDGNPVQITELVSHRQ